MEQAHYKLIAQMNHLYITWRRDFLQQHPNGYSTQKYSLTDNILAQHLAGKRTVGVKLGTQGLTKFQTWDVDYKDNPEKAQEVTIQLVRALHEYWGIPLEEIHIDFSGSKGYHVTLFYDKIIQDVALYPFYREVVAHIGESERNVEFRCSSKYGMKLPLGINQKSQKFMGFVRYNPQAEQLEHLGREASYDYFLQIEQSDWEEFKELVLQDVDITALQEPTAERFEEVFADINIDGKSLEELEKELQAVLTQGRLTYQGSRNRVTLLLSIFFKEQGYELDETISLTKGILQNTWDTARELISPDTTREHMHQEAERIAKNTFQRDYTFTTRRRDVTLQAEEIEHILSIKEYHLKKLLFSLLVHSKRYAKPTGVFYMSYSTMERMGNTTERGRILGYLHELEGRGHIQIVAQNVIDPVQSRLQGRVIKKPNEYRVLIQESLEQANEHTKKAPAVTLKHNEDMTLEQITALLLDEKSAKKKLPRGQWDSRFKPAYQALSHN